MDILGLIFPKKCVGCKKLGSYLCSSCFTHIEIQVPALCAVCSRYARDGRTHPQCSTKYAIDGVIAAVVYKGVIKRLVYQFKSQPHLSDLQKVITEIFYESIIQNEQFHLLKKDNSLLVPIPLHTNKLKVRGYNQAALLAKSLSIRLRLPSQELLVRIKTTVSQVKQTRQERRANINGAFVLKRGVTIKNKTVFLIDDLVTSGATLNEAAGVLKKAGVEQVWGIAFAQG